jgi:hypothetical protein
MCGVYEADFYNYALDMFREAGHADCIIPLYANHTLKQAVYLDSTHAQLLDEDEKEVLKAAYNISHLFDLDYKVFDKGHKKISYYSIVLECSKDVRSQTANNIHKVIHRSFNVDASIVLFLLNGNIMLSIVNDSNDIYLSDWYEYFYGVDELIERINICNLPLTDEYHFVDELVYCCARDYYLHPLPHGRLLFSLLPDNYLTLYPDSDYGTLMDALDAVINEVKDKYGNDYVEPDHSIPVSTEEIEDQLELIGLELASIENEEDLDVEQESSNPMDKYEYRNIPKDVLSDPIRLLKWIESNGE